MTEEEVLALQPGDRDGDAARRLVWASAVAASTAPAVVAWLVVGIPIAWGVWVTLSKAWVLFG